MFPLWLVYLLIALLLLLDVLLAIEVAVVGIFLAAYVAYNIVTALVGRKIDRYLRERMDRLKQEAEARSQSLGKAAGHAKGVYSLLFLLYRIYDAGTSLLIASVAAVLLLAGFAGLAAVNVALLLLLNAYIL